MSLALDRLTGWIERDRKLVALWVPLFGVLGMSLADLSGWPWLQAAATFPPMLIAANLVMAAPLALGLALALRDEAAVVWRALLGLLLLALFSYAIESIGVETGWPYGRFQYGLDLRPLIFDRVPLALPLLWLPLVLNACLLAVALLGERGSAVRRLASLTLLATLLLVLEDGLLDPGAVALGFWSWETPGPYYGVPWINFGGWLLSGFVGVLIALWAIPPSALRRGLSESPFILDSFRAFLLFWSLANLIRGQWLALIPAAVLAWVLHRFAIDHEHP